MVLYNARSKPHLLKRFHVKSSFRALYFNFVSH